MLRARLPTRREDAWDCAVVLNPPPALEAVNGHGGLVIAGGPGVYMLRPGAATVQVRESPLGPGPTLVVAAEARPPWRFAVANDAEIAIFVKDKKKQDAVIRTSPSEEGAGRATHMAWARDADASVLYVRWENGTVSRTKRNMGGMDPLDLAWADALASDSAGNLALAHFASNRCRVYHTRDGREMVFHELDLPADQEAHMHLAVAGDAVAFSIDREGAFVSRARGAGCVRCDPLATAGPIAFEGASTDAALFGALETATAGSIVRVDREGGATVIAEFEGDDGSVPEIAALSWDATRERLWAASPEMGLCALTAPSAKRRGKAPLS